jgi:pimeloyl-ACP methyl ester carboxylesterase
MRTILHRRAVLTGGAGLALAACASVEGAVTAESPRGQIEYVARGGRGRGVLFLHGLGVGVETWTRVLDPIGAQARAVAYNRSGYGNSGWREGARLGAAIAKEAEDAAILAGLSPPVLLVGHSLGGLYAQAIAQQTPHLVWF